MPITIEKKERCISITWERPPLNVLDITLLNEIDQALGKCADDSGADLVVLKGAGTRAFSAVSYTHLTLPTILRV